MISKIPMTILTISPIRVEAAEEHSDNDEDSEHDADEVDEVDTPQDDDAAHLSTKRKADTDTITLKRTKIENEEDKVNKKARIDAIWKEMNAKPSNKKEPLTPTDDITKHPLDDISASLNQAPAPTHEKTSTPEKPRKSANTIRRPKSTLSDLVSQYNIKVPKMNTLDKSRLDWQHYVDREGIRDDLKYRNKDGYMEKVAFLNRVDDRRLTHLKTGQRSLKK
ncbi:bucentaur or craniofacial development-domain-containing protein [Radiomyces spectabilis]|uniref:bucentaur or craniofacial development-domain-containing protein n=1 Tax=Radiomyces spectabilis TaxID=64574 RepID=UPI0022204F67|nr:bucentaur or craniofacial development-domain-containing protein [Radiomyces spectabilis]KAI8393649.1 bucentaur or craniofacial development-domain-containing protein [Radiomyces spectabilis]